MSAQNELIDLPMRLQEFAAHGIAVWILIEGDSSPEQLAGRKGHLDLEIFRGGLYKIAVAYLEADSSLASMRRIALDASTIEKLQWTEKERLELLLNPGEWEAARVHKPHNPYGP